MEGTGIHLGMEYHANAVSYDLIVTPSSTFFPQVDRLQAAQDATARADSAFESLQKKLRQSSSLDEGEGGGQLGRLDANTLSSS